MRERLIELMEKFKYKCLWSCKDGFIEIAKDCDICVENQLADYLRSNGVIVPPVCVGQKVWYIKGGYYNSANKRPCEIEVTEINQKWHGKILDWGFIANGTRYRFSSIGKTVFLTKEEAEQALKGGEE